MKIADTDIFLVPGFGATPNDHWIHRWCEKITTARLIDMPTPFHPVRHRWVDAIIDAVDTASRPVVLVGHSLGANAIVHAAHRLKTADVRGAFLVAPTDLSRDAPEPGFVVGDFLPLPRAALPFTTRVIASRTDPHCTAEVAQSWAKAWGAQFQDAGDAGHINHKSGHGPWPEGLMTFAYLMKSLG